MVLGQTRLSRRARASLPNQKPLLHLANAMSVICVRNFCDEKWGVPHSFALFADESPALRFAIGRATRDQRQTRVLLSMSMWPTRPTLISFGRLLFLGGISKRHRVRLTEPSEEPERHGRSVDLEAKREVLLVLGSGSAEAHSQQPLPSQRRESARPCFSRLVPVCSHHLGKVYEIAIKATSVPKSEQKDQEPQSFGVDLGIIDSRPVPPHSNPEKKQCNWTDHAKNAPWNPHPERHVCGDDPA
jgi:hypothetical protein